MFVKIFIIKDKVNPIEFKTMLGALRSYIKLAVDIKRKVIAGGGLLHADCEAALLEDGSRQEDIWGADWIPATEEVRFEALINIRPRHGNRSMSIQNPEVRKEVEEIVRQKFIV